MIVLEVMWYIYATFMTIVSWGRVESFEDWMISMMVWIFMMILPTILKGNN